MTAHTQSRCVYVCTVLCLEIARTLLVLPFPSPTRHTCYCKIPIVVAPLLRRLLYLLLCLAWLFARLLCPSLHVAVTVAEARDLTPVQYGDFTFVVRVGAACWH
jgi:hypothetical protein